MDEWKNWLNADYAFSNNGKKIKAVAKKLFTINLVLIFIAAAIGFIGFLSETLNGHFEYVWFIPIVIAIVLLFAPFLVYWNLSFVYGFGELVSNSYKKIETTKDNTKKDEKPFKSQSEKQPLSYTNPTTNNAVQHTFRCSGCGNMISEDVCPICKYDNSVTSSKAANVANSVPTEKDTIICSICKFEQPKDRKVCWHCGAKFEKTN